MKSSRLVIVCGTVAFLVIGGFITRLAINHVDAGPLLAYLASILTPLAPIFYTLFRQEKTLPAIQEVAAQAAEHAENAAATAAQVEHNTNGALTMRFDEIKACIRDVSGKIDTHLSEHAKESVK